MQLFSKEERKILFFTNAGHFFAHSLILIFPAITTPLATEFGLPFEEVLKISFLMYLFYGIGALPSGLITDRIHPRFSLAVYFIGIGTFSILTSFIRTKLQLEMTLMMMGIFLSLYHPAGIGLLSRFKKNRGMALGINGTFGSIGIAAAPFVAGSINYFLGWRAIYAIMGVFPTLLGIFLFISGLSDYTQKAESDKHTGGPSNTVVFVILCVSMSLAGFVYRGQTLILPSYFEQRIDFLYKLVRSLEFFQLEGAKTLSATILASLVYVVSIFGQILGGKIADKYDLRRAYLLFFLCALPFLVMMYFFRDVPLFAASIFFILCSMGMQPVENSLIAHLTPAKWRNTSYGLKFTLTFGVSSVVIYPIGFFQTKYGLQSVFLFFSLVIVVLVLNNTLLILVSSYRKKPLHPLEKTSSHLSR